MTIEIVHVAVAVAVKVHDHDHDRDYVQIGTPPQRGIGGAVAGAPAGVDGAGNGSALR